MLTQHIYDDIIIEIYQLTAMTGTVRSAGFKREGMAVEIPHETPGILILELQVERIAFK